MHLPRRNIILPGLLIVSNLASSLVVVFSTHLVRNEYAQLQVLELERWQLEEDYTRLLLEMSASAAPDRIQGIAIKQLSMRTPDLRSSNVVIE